jgi:phosphoenolpyruvate synthase/pyruvate phosphate dikinase
MIYKPQTMCHSLVPKSCNALQMESKTGKTFGDPKNPLLVSVRSGAAVSMPGMMDTVRLFSCRSMYTIVVSAPKRSLCTLHARG